MRLDAGEEDVSGVEQGELVVVPEVVDIPVDVGPTATPEPMPEDTISMLILGIPA